MTARIRPMLVASLVLAIAAPALPATASAACNWEWLCNGDGACRQTPICDALDETPPPKPEVAAPKPPPMGMRPQQLSQSKGGNVTCEQVMRQTTAGNWKWEEACYCNDDAKARDSSQPMSNMVRCAPGTLLSGTVAQ